MDNTQRILTLILTLTAICLTFVACQQGFQQNNQWDRSRRPGNEIPPWCDPNSAFPCWEPPFYPYDEIHRTIGGVGRVIGRSMIYRGNPDRYINIFLGVPYARPPIDKLRFQPPEDPGPCWDIGQCEWDASYYRPACPQEIWKLDKTFYEPRNISEDCLYLNIFSPNLTDVANEDKNRDYPILLFIHGDDYKLGDAQEYAGHVLAKKETLVITFNYRLGALGFLSTLDQNAPGNYGLLDVIKVLEWIQKYIKIFRGDPNKVTIAGHSAGASIVGLLLVSPRSTSSGKALFHRAIMMAGSDLCEWSVVKPVYNTNAREYAKDLGRNVGCNPDWGLPQLQLVECLRGKHFEEIVNASASIYKHYGSFSGPFGPVVDGNIKHYVRWDQENKLYPWYSFLPDYPKTLRDQGKFLKMDILAGYTKDEGAFLAENRTKDLVGVKISEGLDPGTFRDIIYKIIREKSYIRNPHETVAAVEYEYTFWAKPDNTTAVRQNLIDLYSDMMVGSCVDAMVKYHAAYDNPVYVYMFDHRSELELLPDWMGVPARKDVDYLFGHPFFNDTLGNITGIVPDQWEWTVIDRNISVFVQDMWINFTKYGIPTLEWTRNVTWYPYSLSNLSYLHIQEFSWMDINFRQNHYAFWRNYFPTVSSWWPLTTTPGPTPYPRLDYEVATWVLVGATFITIFIIASLGITLWRRNRYDTPPPGKLDLR